MASSPAGTRLRTRVVRTQVRGAMIGGVGRHRATRPERSLGVFEFVIVLVVVTTIGKIVSESLERRALPPAGGSTSPDAVDALRDEIADLGARLHRLEEERDFYRDLLEAPDVDRRSLQPPSPEEPPSSG